MFKKVVGVLLIVGLLMSLTGCSNSRLSMLNSSSKNEYEAIDELEQKLVDALENKDRELLKSIFSEKAISRSSDIEEGIDYIFNLYKGDFIEITERNHSSTGYYGPEGTELVIYGWFIIKTTEETYRIDYDYWYVQEIELSELGVYTLRFEKYEEGEYTPYWSVAGIVLPQHEKVHTTLTKLFDSFRHEDTHMLSSLFQISDEEKENIMKSSDEVIEVFASRYISTNMGDGWLVYDGSTFHVYVEGYFPSSDYIIYFRYDTTPGNEDKIYLMKFTEIKEGTSLEDYELGENLTEAGIYLE